MFILLVLLFMVDSVLIMQIWEAFGGGLSIRGVRGAWEDGWVWVMWFRDIFEDFSK
mgnify:CR=1 FL=1